MLGLSANLNYLVHASKICEILCQENISAKKSFLKDDYLFTITGRY